jgi:hypothetical protein
MAAGGVPFLCPFKLLFENLTTLFVKEEHMIVRGRNN